MIPDATFKGHLGARTLLSVLLPELTLEADEPTVSGVRATSEARLQGALVRSWGLQTLRVRREVVALDGKVQHLTLAVHPEDALHLLWAIPRANKAVVHRFHEGINRHDLSLIDEVVSPDFIQHSSLPISPGRQGLKEYFTRFWSAFPDARITIDDMLAEGDRVSIRATGRYTHKGPYLGVAPTNRSIVITRIAIFRVWGGMILEHCDEADRLGLLQQLGAVPTLPQWSVSPGYEGFR
jgi:predicted ester cyclase